jgi:hypothetical protein
VIEAQGGEALVGEETEAKPRGRGEAVGLGLTIATFAAHGGP